MLEYNYYWYHHMMPSKDREAIQKCLDEKDYFGFLDWYKKLGIKGTQQGYYNEEFECWLPVIYLPSHISVYDTEKEIYVDTLCVCDKTDFMKITHSECECG